MCVTAAALAAPVAALVRRCGAPVRVASRDDGHHFSFLDDGATVDAVVDPDRDVVRALEVSAPAPLTFNVDAGGAARTLAFGSYALGQAEADFADAADNAFASNRAYRLDDARELVLSFDPATQRLTRIAIGERATLVRLGDLPQPIDQPPFPYAAPVLKHTALADGNGSHATIVRIDIDANGIVRAVTVVVASDDPAFDAALARRLGDDRYTPARLGGRPIAGSVFRELRH
jgi:hypothetical protein